MSKIITSPVKRFPGTVVLADPLTFPQANAFEDALVAVRELGDGISLTKQMYAWLPGILPCVEEWHLNSGFPERPALDNFPRTPGDPIARLVFWLVGEITALYKEADEVPLA